MPDTPSEHPKPFWTTVPGILTGLAALIAALVTAYNSLNPPAKSPEKPVPAVEAKSTPARPPTIQTLGPCSPVNYQSSTGDMKITCP